jgi:Flp pilus assembly protein TadG
VRRASSKLSRGTRGVALIIFLLMIVPAFIFGTALSIDISKVVTTFNYNTNTAQLAANAASTARDVNSGLLNPGNAVARAHSVCAGMNVAISNCAVYVNGSTATVRVFMKPFFLTSQWFAFPDGSLAASPLWSGLTAGATSSVCNSLQVVGPSDQECVRPKE